jgi:hypothetical protein
VEIVVTTRRARLGTRYFVQADQAVLVLVNPTTPRLSAGATRTLRSMIAHHPERFAATQMAGTWVEDNVRIGRDGLFVADRRVADLDQLVETIPRNDVLEIRGPVVARGSVMGTVLGGWLGFCVGVVPGLAGASEGVAWVLLISSTAVGGVLGFHWSSHDETDGVVYREP